jgi:hypothetical protein
MRDVVYAASNTIAHNNADMHTEVVKCVQAAVEAADKLLLRSE